MSFLFLFRAAQGPPAIRRVSRAATPRQRPLRQKDGDGDARRVWIAIAADAGGALASLENAGSKATGQSHVG